MVLDALGLDLGELLPRDNRRDKQAPAHQQRLLTLFQKSQVGLHLTLSP